MRKPTFLLFFLFQNKIRSEEECTEKYKMNDFLLNRESPGK